MFIDLIFDGVILSCHRNLSKKASLITQAWNQREKLTSHYYIVRMII